MLPRPRRIETLVDKIQAMKENPKPKKYRLFGVELPTAPKPDVKDYKVITNAVELVAYLKRCEETGLCGFDYETSISDEYRKMCHDKRGHILQLDDSKERTAMLKEWKEDYLKAPLDPWKANICTVSLSATPNEARVIFIDNEGVNKFNGTREEVFELLDTHLFKNQKITKIAVNLSFETKHTLKLGKYILSPVADPFIMWVRCMQLIMPEKIENPKAPASGKGLKPMTKEIFGVEMQDFTALLEKHGVEFFAEISADHPDALSYSAEDSDYAVQHYLYWREIAKQIPKYDEWLHDIEMPFTRVIGSMEYWGMSWDNDLAEVKRQEAEIARNNALREVEAIAREHGCNITLNKTANVIGVKNLLFNVLNAPISKTSKKTGNVSLDGEALIDLKFMLENKLQDLKEEDYLAVELVDRSKRCGETGLYQFDYEIYSRAKQAKKKEILSRPEYEHKESLLKLIDLIMQVQKSTTLISSHIIGRQNYLNAVSGRIHANYHQWTETGRLGSRNPNQQNTPAPHNDKLGVRNFYVAEPGKVLFLIDFSGFELRILSWRADDKVMQDIFIHNGDMHRKTAATATGKPESEVTKVERTHAKPVNFGIAYCATEHALQKTFKTDYGIRKPLDECAKLISAVKVAYPNIPKFQREIAVDAREKGYVETIYGFKRLLPNIASTNIFLRQSDERRASNTPIQGSAADIMKRCQNWAYEFIGSNPEHLQRARLIGQVHDEQLFELDDDVEYVKRFTEAVKAEMERPPIEGFPLPIEADSSIAYRWGEKMGIDKYLEMREKSD